MAQTSNGGPSLTSHFDLRSQSVTSAGGSKASHSLYFRLQLSKQFLFLVLTPLSVSVKPATFGSWKAHVLSGIGYLLLVRTTFASSQLISLHLLFIPQAVIHCFQPSFFNIFVNVFPTILTLVDRSLACRSSCGACRGRLETGSRRNQIHQPRNRRRNTRINSKSLRSKCRSLHSFRRRCCSSQQRWQPQYVGLSNQWGRRWAVQCPRRRWRNWTTIQ